MARIICPNCGEVIDVDPSAVEDLTRQLRDELFERDLEARMAQMGHAHAAQVEAMRAQERREADQRVAEVQAELLKATAKLEQQKGELESRLRAATGEQALALERERGAAAEQLAQLREQLAAAQEHAQLEAERVRSQAAAEREALQRTLDEQRMQAQEQRVRAAEEAQARQAQLEAEALRLKAQLDAQRETLQAQGEAELLRATSELERQKGELESLLAVERANGEQAQAALREEMAKREGELSRRNEEQLEARDEQIERYKAELERLRDYRMRLSTKLVGESLERHCESEFNRIRMQAYPNASFEKDNTAVEGTKGDFIFRDYDEDGNELLSIMFEMKNEEEMSASSSRKRNEDHLKKLDADRTKKHCEYAVLVSTLDPENDFYNAGIADVSWHYPKMFVVRPQCFTTIIGLLKAAALTAHPYRMQLERARREELDVTTFEQKVATIVGSIENDYTRAAKNYERAEADIDAIIKKLEDLKKQLRTATTWFGAAQKQGQKLTIKRLTRGNATMKAAFAQAEAARQEDDEETPFEDALPEAGEAPVDPDATE